MKSLQPCRHPFFQVPKDNFTRCYFLGHFRECGVRAVIAYPSACTGACGHTQLSPPGCALPRSGGVPQALGLPPQGWESAHTGLGAGSSEIKRPLRRGRMAPRGGKVPLQVAACHPGGVSPGLCGRERITPKRLRAAPPCASPGDPGTGCKTPASVFRCSRLNVQGRLSSQRVWRTP